MGADIQKSLQLCCLGAWSYAQPAEFKSYCNAIRQKESSLYGPVWKEEWEEITATKMEVSQRYQKIYQGKEKMKISREKICRAKVSKMFFSLFYRQNLKEQCMN